jgi:hypothetical protein
MARTTKPQPTRPDSYLSVTAALSTFGKPDGLTGYTAGRIADEIVYDVHQADEKRLEVLHELMAEHDTPKTTRSMRWEAESTAWRALQWAQRILDDPRKGKNDLTRARFDPPRNTDTGQVFALGATALGSAIHDTCERWAITGKRPDNPHPEVAPFMDAYDQFLQAYQPEVIAAEATGINQDMGYAGRLDTILNMHVPGMGKGPVLVDFKSKREDTREYGGVEEDTKPFESVALQLTAYKRFTHIIRWSDAVRVKSMTQKGGMWYEVEPEEYQVALPMVPVQAGVVLHMTPKRCTPHPVYFSDWLDRAWEQVLASARIYYSPAFKKAIGPAMAPPHRPDLTQPDLTSRLEASLEARGVLPAADDTVQVRDNVIPLRENIAGS